MVFKYDSIGEFLKHYDKVGARTSQSERGWSSFELGNKTYETMRKAIVSGEIKNRDMVTSIMDKVNASVHIEHQTWEPSVIGAYPCVPDYLSGNPLSMRRLLPLVSDSSPVTVWVSIAPSGSVTYEQYLRRGVTICALVEKLKEIRPTTLRIFDEGSGNDGMSLVSIALESNPISLAHILPTISEVAMFRILVADLEQKLNGSPWGWPKGFNTPSYFEQRKTLLGIGDSDLVIPAAHKSETLMLTNPVEWINKQLAKYQAD